MQLIEYQSTGLEVAAEKAFRMQGAAELFLSKPYLQKSNGYRGNGLLMNCSLKY